MDRICKKSKVFQCLLTLTLLGTLFGCSSITYYPTANSSLEPKSFDSNAIVQQNAEATLSSKAAEKSKQLSTDTTLSSFSTNEELTPNQFLNLLCGNAEELAFFYTITDSATGRAETRSFQRLGDTAVECYHAEDMYGNPISVRELEHDGKVHYIMDDYQMVKTYLAPAEDFLLYQMMDIAKGEPSRVLETGECILYEYSLPFAQDECTPYYYCFFMRDGQLQKLTESLGDTPNKTYEFSSFYQEAIDQSAFDEPHNYVSQDFHYSYTGEHMPPWWELTNID